MRWQSFLLGESLKTVVKSKNGWGEPDSRKADKARLYALRGGLTQKMVCTAHFCSQEVFIGDLTKAYEFALAVSVSAVVNDKAVVPQLVEENRD